jgi:hypothetical protein
MARAYGKQVSSAIEIEAADLPENFYEKEVEYAIHINKKVQWRVSLGADPSIGDLGGPWFRLVFFDSKTNSSGQVNLNASGQVKLRVDPENRKLHFRYESAPVPDPTKINGVVDFNGYEATIRERLQPIIDVQLAHELQ